MKRSFTRIIFIFFHINIKSFKEIFIFFLMRCNIKLFELVNVFFIVVFKNAKGMRRE